MKAKKGTKAAFLAAFGHDADYHRRFDVDTAGPKVVGAITMKRQSAADLPVLASGCGWWWCTSEADSVPWSELQKAHERLVQAGIDPHGPHVAELGNEHARVREWAKERDPYEILGAALEGVRDKVPSESDAGKLRRECLETIRQRHRHAMVSKGEGNSRKPLQAAIVLGKSWGWDYPKIAAALVLTGAEKVGPKDPSRPISGFAAIVDLVRKAGARLK
jgi:hypothetical protein